MTKLSSIGTLRSLTTKCRVNESLSSEDSSQQETLKQRGCTWPQLNVWKLIERFQIQAGFTSDFLAPGRLSSWLIFNFVPVLPPVPWISLLINCSLPSLFHGLFNLLPFIYSQPVPHITCCHLMPVVLHSLYVPSGWDCLLSPVSNI